MNESAVPALRLRTANAAPVRVEREYVLYWMIAQRRCEWNFALQRAVEHARTLDKPLVILEALRCGYRWASDRLHRFVLDGMQDNAERCARAGVAYYPYVEPAPGAGRGLLAAMAARAAIVVTDESPVFFLPRMVKAAAATLDVQLEVVDSNGLMPLAATPSAFPSAYAFRRFLQRSLRPHLAAQPLADPLAAAPRNALPADWAASFESRWPRATPELLAGDAAALAALPIDHTVGVAPLRGGAEAGARALQAFLFKVKRYAGEHSQPEAEVTSGLSPYLHFGHVASHAVLHSVVGRDGWTPDHLSERSSGQREGWWGTNAATEAFLDELVTWRELGYVFAWHRPDYDQWDSLPDWARATLDAHRSDPRPHVYDLDAFTAARTHDPLWNAAQTQLVREGRIHNYMRMLWGKKILEWSATPEAALATMIELNNRFALDGRDPNSYSGIFWVLGRFDRPWAPQRPIFGVIRWMSSANTARKLRVAGYVARYTPEGLGL